MIVVQTMCNCYCAAIIPDLDKKIKHMPLIMATVNQICGSWGISERSRPHLGIFHHLYD